MTDFHIDLSDPAYNKALIAHGVTGTVRYAPLKTDAPADNLGAYPDGYTPLGWVAKDGVTESYKEEAEELDSMCASGPVLTMVKDQEVTLKVPVLTTSGLAIGMFYNVSQEEMNFDESTGVTTFTQGGGLPDSKTFRLALDVLHNAGHRRLFLPAATVIEREDMGYTRDNMLRYNLTFKATVDPKLNYAVRREFKEGWKPGTTGSTNTAAAGLDFGTWNSPITAAED